MSRKTIDFGEQLDRFIQKACTSEISQQLAQIFDEYGDAPYPKIIRNGYNTSY
jgi:hypothetical protein